MANYVLLYNGGALREDPAEREASMKAWGAWFGRLGGALVDGGHPFSGQVKSIASDGSVHAGAVGASASGYSIVKADSLDAAVELARGCPVLQDGAQISVFETLQVG